MAQLLNKATNKPMQFDLELIDGTYPNDLYGHLFINSPVGNVNCKDGLPHKKELAPGVPNPSWGNCIFNGDGYIWRFDFKPDKISVKTNLFKTPCYYADYALRYPYPNGMENWRFHDLGIARTSFKLGTRNQINTSLNSFRFGDDPHPRMTANFDMGRPWEFDVESLELKTPVGNHENWINELPKFIQRPFNLYQSSAHPSYDPNTKEFFFVNFLKSASTMVFNEKFADRMLKHEEHIHRAFSDHVGSIHKQYVGGLDRKVRRKIVDENAEAIHKEITSFFHDVDFHIAKHRGFLHHVWAWIKRPFQLLGRWLKKILGKFLTAFTGMQDAVFLMRWDGSEKMKKWKLLDEEGKSLKIYQIMHQTGLTRDYIVLMDTAMKLALDTMVNNPFPHDPELSKLLQELTTRKILPETPTYIVSRADLRNDVDEVRVRTAIIPLETVHFSLDYNNDDDKITMHAAHNCASCAAEWNRPYDKMEVNGKLVTPFTCGLPNTGEVDLGRIGKVVFDGKSGSIMNLNAQDQLVDVIAERGFEESPGNGVKGHTWAVGFHTYRNKWSSETLNEKIKYIFWQSYGLDPRFLTHFIADLYENYSNRLVPFKDLVNFTQEKVPFAIVRENAFDMKLEDSYVFKMNQIPRTIEFIPRKRDEGHAFADFEDQLDGYIFANMILGDPEDLETDGNYEKEIWIFDASKLAKGPICRLGHKDMSYAFTIHSHWIPECTSLPGTPKVDVVADFRTMIDNFKDGKHKQEVQAFMEDHVYGNFR